MAEFGDSESDAGSVDSTIKACNDILPNELIAHILTMGSTLEPLRVRGWRNHSLPFALLVSSISRRWRETAISLPLLWSRLLFTVDARSESWISCLFLPRSGRRPLDICIDMEYSHRSMARALEIILPHRERWRKLCLIPWGDEDLWITLRIIWDISVPLLQQLEILVPYEPSGVGEGITADTSHTRSFKLAAPALTSLSLRGPYVACDPPPANLTAFLFDSDRTLSHQQLQSIVAASPALRILRLRLRSFEAYGQGPMNIPSLRELSLDLGYKDDFALLCVAPDLESLEIATLSDFDVAQLLLHCTQYSNYPRLQTLKLSKLYNVSSSSYRALFSLCPTVTSLFLLDCDSTPALSQLPALKHITYSHNPYHSPGRREEARFIKWISKHVRACHGTLQAMESVHTNRSAHRIRAILGYHVDVVELADSADSLRDSWVLG